MRRRRRNHDHRRTAAAAIPDRAAHRRARGLLVDGELAVRRPEDRLLHPGRPTVAAAAHLVAGGGGAVLRALAAPADRGDPAAGGAGQEVFAKATVGGVRFATFVLASAGRAGVGRGGDLVVSDATRDRVYFGTDTRAQALLIGSAASALLVRDWASLNRGWCLIRTRGARRIARFLPSSGSRGWRRRPIRHGQRRRVPARAADRGRCGGRAGGRAGGAGAARRGCPRAGLAPPGVPGHHFLRRLPVALADLSGAQRRTHRMVRGRAVRSAVCRHGGSGRVVVVADRTTDPALATVAGAAVAASGGHGGQRRGGDVAGGSGGNRARST